MSRKMTEGGGLEVEEVIGHGTFAKVYRVRPAGGGGGEGRRHLALKKIHLAGMSSPKAIADCVKEITLLQQLDHPNIIRYISSFVEGDELNLVLELADEGDLRGFIASFRQRLKLIPEHRIWQIFQQVASGLQHMHERRIMHRDLKPANVFLTGGLEVKLGDLGLSRYFSPQTLAAESLVGTPYYMSPERLRGDSYDFSSDIWSLGCLLYEMGSLQAPFYERRLNLRALTKKIISGHYPPLPSPIYSDKMRQLINYCLRTEKEDRPDIDYVKRVAQEMSAAFSAPSEHR